LEFGASKEFFDKGIKGKRDKGRAKIVIFWSIFSNMVYFEGQLSLSGVFDHDAF